MWLVLHVAAQSWPLCAYWMTAVSSVEANLEIPWRTPSAKVDVTAGKRHCECRKGMSTFWLVLIMLIVGLRMHNDASKHPMQ